LIHRVSKYLFLILIFFNSQLIGAKNRESSSIKIVAAGDLMLGRWVQEVVLSEGWDYPFRQIDSVLSDADIFFVNLEAPFGIGGEPFDKTYTFRVPPSFINVLMAGGINVVSLANNHIMDYGPDVLAQTREFLQKHNIKFSGAGENLKAARKPAVLTIKDKSVAIASYSLTFPQEFWATDTSAGTCFPYDTFFYDDIRSFKENYDLVIVSFHWSAELLNKPKDYQIELAHKTIDMGADLIIGHHPHVIQGIEIYKGKIIAYSLGNFVFGSYSENARVSMILKFFYGTNSINKCRIYPINVYNKEVEFRPRLLIGECKVNFLKELQNLSRELNDNQVVVSNDGWINLEIN